MSAVIRPEELLGELNETERRFAPPELFVEGDTGLFHNGARISIVGTRKPSAEGTRRAERIVRKLVERQCVIVSGLAEGIDTIAHTTTINAGGRTIAVLGTSLAETFPRQNRGLQERIAREHLLISQFPVGHPALAKNFPIRNRLMALVSDATIIIEAGETSGTRHQGWEAIRLKRPLFIMTCAPKWVQEMVDYGAQTPTEDELLEVIFDVVPTGNRDAVAL